MENRKMLVLGAIGGLFLLLILPLLIGACMKGGKKNTPNPNANISTPVSTVKTLKVWALHDSQELYQGLFQEFYTSHPGVQIEYTTFQDEKEYRKFLIDSIAEGKGPDVAMIDNNWLLKDKNKFLPFPNGQGSLSVEKFKSTFVGSAADSLVLPDGENIPRIYGLTGSVDSLALYYNKKYFRDYVLSSTVPSEIWTNNSQTDLISQVIKINHPDLSFERFNPAGIALGRADNISKAIDIFSLLLLQYKGKLYDDEWRTSQFGSSNGINPATSEAIFPSLNALQLFTSFTLSEYKHFSWNEMITRKEKDTQEIGAFASGKVAMMFGYASTLTQIQEDIKAKRQSGKPAMEENDIGITFVPQVSDNPSEGRVTLAHFYPWVVPKNTTMELEAWDLILTLVNESAQQAYWEKAKKPTSLPSLIDIQAQDPVYGVFAIQASYARTLPIIDSEGFTKMVYDMIMRVAEGRNDPKTSVTIANTQFQCLLDQYNKAPGKVGISCVGN